VAVGFQVVLIVGQTDVIVPENLSAAANYNCMDCLTYALASQLVLTLDGPLGEASLAQLNALWAEIAEYGRNIQNVPLSEIQGRLTAYKEQITAIIQADPGATKGKTAGSTSSPTTPAVPGSSPSGTTASGTSTGGEAPAPAGTTPANAPATQPAPGDAPPSYAPVETVAPTADTGGTAPAVEPVPTANPS
jgi:putative peptide zinc metalloprotease protein